MTRSKTLLLALALASVPALAGCIGAAGATANDTKDTAAEAAQAWSDDAELVSIEGVDGAFPSMPYGSMAAQSTDGEKDTKVGDGRALFWSYRYVSPSKQQSYEIIVDHEGKILDEDEGRTRSSDVALGDYKIDSDTAVKTALKVNKPLADGVDNDNFGLLLELSRDDGRPTWQIMGGGYDGETSSGGYVSIDAVSGDVIASEGGSQSR